MTQHNLPYEWKNRIVGYRVVKASELLDHPDNWRNHPDSQIENMGEILNDVGQVAPLIVSKRTGRILDGHMRKGIAGDSDVGVLDVDVDEIEEKKILATFDPLGAQAEADNEKLEALLQEISDIEEPEIDEAVLDDLAELEGMANSLTRGDVPDALWASDNEWGIPLLDINLQADAVDLPVRCWGVGRNARKRKMPGTWLFYTEDYRYTALWSDPSAVVNTGCVSIVEPNYSCYGQTPRAVALWRIYQKRYLARTWQMFGLRVFVDMNVNDVHFDINMLGIPKGWRAYATRGYVERIDYIAEQYHLACERRGGTDILFMVYGGGKAVIEECRARGWNHIAEENKITAVIEETNNE